MPTAKNLNNIIKEIDIRITEFYQSHRSHIALAKQREIIRALDECIEHSNHYPLALKGRPKLISKLREISRVTQKSIHHRCDAEKNLFEHQNSLILAKMHHLLEVISPFYLNDNTDIKKAS